ncbi:MAG: leucine-rich repeat domain-containing protein [Bacteroidaceae bacterium]|nr:leucine-rich repeat domain-containing protein [Bacteroidaceae bacterium]
MGCSSLTSVTIPTSITSIGENAFEGCSSLPVIDNIRYADTYLVEVIDHKCTSVNVKEGTRYIGSHAFETCLWLTSVTIPNSVTNIGDHAFEFCSSLTSVNIPNSVTSLGNGAFQYCSSLTSIDIPNSVTNLGEGAFSGCSRLTSITISNSITSIKEATFSRCGLISVTIPNSVKNIESYAFYGCLNIQDIHSNNPTPPTIDDNNIFSGINTTQCVIYVPKGAKEDYASANGWKDFYNIVEEEVNAIDPAVMPNTNSNGASIFTISGEKVMNANHLPIGIYIKNGKKVRVK